jgi:hypothetical protein
MSMNFSEFKRLLGADPGNQDPAFLRARESSEEFIRAAAESDRFERRLERALDIPVPGDLLSSLEAITATPVKSSPPWRNYAIAASLLLAVAAAGLTWRMNTVGFDSVEQYVVYHYNHDGERVLISSEGQTADDVDTILARFDVEMAPDLSQMVSLIKYCPTPEGKGAHIVLNTPEGPITVIYMPGTPVTDGEMMDFDGMQAQLVSLAGGSAAIIGSRQQRVGQFYGLVQNAFITIPAKA